jgi:DNA-binding transcriptional LysR family regulator
LRDDARGAVDHSAGRERDDDLTGLCGHSPSFACDAAPTAPKIKVAARPAAASLPNLRLTLFHDRLVIAAGVHNQLARRRKIDLAEIVDEPWILAEPNSWNYLRLAEAFEMQGLRPPKPSLVAFSITLRTYLLANGPYLTSFPNSSVQLNPNRHTLKRLPIDLPAPVQPWPFAILTLKHRTLSPVVESFIKCCREVVANSITGKT